MLVAYKIEDTEGKWKFSTKYICSSIFQAKYANLNMSLGKLIHRR